MTVPLRISVVIPSYNGARYLPETLESVLGQTHLPDEIIVVDDGSTDNTAEVVLPYLGRIRYIRQANGGVSAARNAGLSLATGNWVAFLDSDDVWHPDKLARQEEVVRREPGLVCVHTGFYRFGDASGEHEPPEDVLAGRYDHFSLLRRFVILPSTVLVRNGLPVRFRSWARVNEDCLYFLDLLPHGGFGYVSEPLVGYRKHAAAMTRKPETVVLGYDALFRWIQEQVLSPGEADVLQQQVCQGIADEVRMARWSRDWNRYWRLRNYLQEKWIWPSPPVVLAERIYPRIVYSLKDRLESWRGSVPLIGNRDSVPRRLPARIVPVAETIPRSQYHQVLASSELGGGELVAIEVARSLHSRGLSAPLWVPGEGRAVQRVRELGLDFTPFNSTALLKGGKLRALLASWPLWRRFRRQSPGLVHVHSPLYYGSLSRMLASTGLSRVVHIQLEESDEGLRWALKRPPELIITCARFLIAQVRRCLPEAVREEQWIEAVPNAVDLDRFQPGDRQAARQRVNAPPNTPLLLMLANLAPHKGQETAIRTTALLKQRGIDVCCWLAGEERGGTSVYKARLLNLIREQGVEDRVKLLGYRSDSPDLLRAADFFLLPSTNEGLPLSILEAQATKVPVLASATAGIPEVVRDGETGFLIPPTEPQAYAACIERLLHEPELRHRVTEQAFDFVTRDHSWERYRERILSLYQQLLPQLAVTPEK